MISYDKFNVPLCIGDYLFSNEIDSSNKIGDYFIITNIQGDSILLRPPYTKSKVKSSYVFISNKIYNDTYLDVLGAFSSNKFSKIEVNYFEMYNWVQDLIGF